MNKKLGAFIIIILNIIGAVCLIYYAIPYWTHDTTVPNPEAMIPFQKWDTSAMLLTIGFIPLAIVNVLAMIFVGNGKIKKPMNVLFLIPCLICMGIVGHYWIFNMGSGSIATSATSVPVANIKIQNKDSSEIQYGILYEDGGFEMLDKAFESDGAEIYIANVNNYESKIEHGKVTNKLVNTIVTDSSGKESEADASLKQLLQMIAATIDHDILETKIFKDGKMYFIAIQTNVNWQSPCEFYQYNPDAGQLTNIYNWDNTDVLDVALP